MGLNWLFHLLISIRITKALEIESPNVKTNSIQSIAPRNAIEAVGYRGRGWEGSAMHVKNRPSFCAGWV
jgi:hypothetical protein